MLSSLEGMYGIGIGLVPLLFARVVIGAQGSTSFAHTQHFYWIATGLAILGSVCGIFINYTHNKQHTSSKIINEAIHGKSISIWKPIMFALFLMFFLMTIETVVNWSFVRISRNVFSHGSSITSNELAIRTIEAFGLMLVIQGLSRPLTAFFILPYIDRKWYILFCSILLISAFGWIMGGAFSSSWHIYIIAIMLGMGVGNLWPIIFSYTVEVDNRRSSFIGVWCHITSTSASPIIQLLIASLWVNIAHSDYTSAIFFAPIIIGIIAASAFFIVFIATNKIHENITKKTSTEMQTENIR